MSIQNRISQLDKEIKSSKKKLFRQILGLAIWVLAIYLCVDWYGWKPLALVFLFLWANNISNNQLTP